MKRIAVNAGDKYGRLTIVEELPRASGQGRCYFSCLCDCGNLSRVRADHLKSGRIKSCGCITKTHGQSKKASEYKIWAAMKFRCSNPGHIAYPRYGGRGIDVCERWQTYQNFYTDMGPRPSNAHTLDRIDNSKGYSPDNCRWATSMEQGANKRGNRKMTYDGRTLHLRAWARELKISPSTLSSKIEKVGELAAFDYYLAKLSATNKVHP